MPIERVDRPGESQEATGGKKNSVLIDLAKAERRWKGKKRIGQVGVSLFGTVPRPQTAMAEALQTISPL